MKKLFKKAFSLLMCFVMVTFMVPSAMLTALAWDEYIECEFCGEGCGDDYICSCGEHCSEESGRDCYQEHHCTECGDASTELCDCGKCYFCGGECSADDHGCLECHLAEGMACADCGQCWYEYDTICSRCHGCKVCIGYCSNGDEDHYYCIDCHEDGEICPECSECYLDYDIDHCDSCYTCKDCVYICPECNLCENCVQICENCGEICVECHEANGETCPNCGFCHFGEIYCLDCGICYNCEYICPDCELCYECYGAYHCVICDECFEVNGQCETGGDHCAACCADNNWLCPNCGDCTEVNGSDVVCRDCGACSNCTEICTICGGFCIECAKFEEWLHCGECGECFEGSALMHCSDCYLCENCTEICPECWEYCVDCQIKDGSHCPSCGGCCYYLYEKCQGGCGKCSNCADDFCDICHQCGDCALKNEDHCVECGNCFRLDGREYYTCWDCLRCSDCIGDDKYCYACGGCDDCIATTMTGYHCKGCHLCFSDDVDSCEEECGYCVNCCGQFAIVRGSINVMGTENASDIRVTLIEFGMPEASYEFILSADSESYSFEGIAFGTYTLIIEKEGYAKAEYLVKLDQAENYYSFNIYMVGDINADGKFSATDYLMLKRIIFGTLKVEDIKEQASAMSRCDVIADGNFKAADYFKLKRILFQ